MSFPSTSSPSLSTLLRPFVQLSYPVPRPANPDSFPNANYYDIGILDGCFIISTIAVFAVLREIVRLHIMTPFANKVLFGSTRGYISRSKTSRYTNGSAANGHATNGHANGHHAGNGHYAARQISAKNRVRERNVIRFAEQGWAIVYASVWWCFGLYIHLSLPTSPWNLDYLWIGFPHNPLPGPLKVYYLTQCAFWIHQVLILNAEAHRKDHVQMMAHHVITVCLVYPILRPITFVPNTQDPITVKHYYAFNALLGALEVLMMVWFISIINVAWSVLRGKPAEDVRSDEELPDSSDEEDHEEKKCK
ncbi:SubName: Full=Related to protein LAC1 {ECO:0000313/EMBL:CCA71791.1} [Serendipita indica DSM 11827]|nr:SubName: Full=Related to protein LAC1 {ECO:0000313/EMBL:CCA71791.1} [Serendipita indica DSM 11827]